MAAASALLLQPTVAQPAESPRVSRQGLMPLELIFKHLLNHRDQIISRHAELVAQGWTASCMRSCTPVNPRPSWSR
jgi:hypothetical protein